MGGSKLRLRNCGHYLRYGNYHDDYPDPYEHPGGDPVKAVEPQQPGERGRQEERRSEEERPSGPAKQLTADRKAAERPKRRFQEVGQVTRDRTGWWPEPFEIFRVPFRQVLRYAGPRVDHDTVG